nr:unnamed protein product [Callosobruchus analis]
MIASVKYISAVKAKWLPRVVKQQINNEETPNTKIQKMLDEPKGRKELTHTSDKQIFSKVVSGDLMQKYRQCIPKNCATIYRNRQNKYKPFLSLHVSIKRRIRLPKGCVQAVQKFFEDNSNIRIGARIHYKKDHRKTGKTFCRLRPFRVVKPSDRDTCLCIIHSTFDMKLHALHEGKVIPYNNYQKLLADLCCDRYNVDCLARSCLLCSTKVPQDKEFDDSKVIKFKMWVAERQEIQDLRTKRPRKVHPRQLTIQLHEDLEKLFAHERNIVHQYKAIKDLKQNLQEENVLMHMDFSENYCTKYAEEIQAFHFGGSRRQLSLHTVIAYLKNSKHSYCTEVPDVEQFTWNYTESGHGKGAPDWCWATCKRTADLVVNSGVDINNIEEFVQSVQKRYPSIICIAIDDQEIQAMTEIVSTGLAFRQIAFTFRISKSSVASIVVEVCKTLWDSLQGIHMPVPTVRDFENVAAQYFNKWNFPNCLGSIDGKHIKLKCPSKSGSMFYNYKNYFSIVLMAVVDANYRFLMIDVGAYGKDSDAGVFSNSPIYQNIENGTVPLPKGQKLPNSEQICPFVFIGDEAFPLRTYLLRPFPRRRLQNNEPASYYNYRLSRARMTVECTFGICSAKFRILLKSIDTKVENAVHISKAICILHNVIIDMEKESFLDDLQDYTGGNLRNNHTSLRMSRANNRPSREAEKLRDAFCQYFSLNKN